MTRVAYSYIPATWIDESAVRQVLTTAMRNWERSGLVQFEDDPQTAGDLHILFEFRLLPTGVCANTTRTGEGRYNIGFNSRLEWSTRLNWFTRLFAKGADLLSIAAHEIGHALGLPHNPWPDSIMQANELNLPSRPGSRDFDLLRHVLA